MVPRSWLGVQVSNAGQVLVVIEGSAAQRANIEVGDKIISINGRTVPKVGLPKVILDLQGAVAYLVIERDGKRYQCTVSKNSNPPTTKSSDSDDTGESESSDDSNSRKYVADDTDESIVSVLRHTEYTANAYDQVIEGLQTVPQGLKKRLAKAGLKVVITPTISDVVSDATERPTGYTHGGNYTNCPAYCLGQTIYVAERVQSGSSVPHPVKNIVASFMHEFGHAYDHTYHISDSPGFLKAYEADCQKLTNTLREEFYYYVQPGWLGPSEMFAEQTSAVLSPPNRLRSTAEGVSKQFPNCYQYVKGIFDDE